MKNLLFIISIIIINTNCYSQVSFEKGYVVDYSNQKTTCLIKNLDWKSNPTSFEYKLSETSEIKIASIKSVKEFGIDNVSKYIAATVNIDRSSEKTNKISYDKNPIFNEEQLFLKILIAGKANLYEYIDVSLKRYFYNIENSKIEQLIYKSYITDTNQISKNNKFKQQLWSALKCPNLKMNKFEGLDYKKEALERLFIAYNGCYNQKMTSFEKKEKKDLFNLSIRPRLNISSLSLKPNIELFENTDFDNKASFGFGLEAEFIFPFNKNKWAITIEPTYQSFNSKQKSNISSALINQGVTKASEITIEADYKSIEIPLSIRHYFFLNEKSKIFVNASAILDISLHSFINFHVTTDNYFNRPSPPDYVNDQSRIPYIFQPKETNAKMNFALGIGYKLYDKYSLEMRYQTNRDILHDNSSWSSDYKTLAIIFGYTLF